MTTYTPSTPTYHDSVPIVEAVDAVNAENNNAGIKSLMESIAWLHENSGGITKFVTIPTPGASQKTYDGTEQELTFSNLDTDDVAVTGNTATDAGNYTAVCTLKNARYAWSDLSNAPKSFPWSIAKAQLTIPTLSGSFVYNGSERTITVSEYDNTKIQVSGITGTDAGTYTATFHIIDPDNYEWTDGTTADKTEDWTISKQTLTVPSVSGTSKTYNGNAQHPTVTGYDNTTMTRTGYEETDAGDYTLVFGLVDSDNYQWGGGSTSFPWSIAKASQTITLSSSSATLDADHLTAQVTATAAGAISSVSNDTSLVTVNASGSPITLTSTGSSGTTTVTVTAAATSNYNSATETINITCEFTPADINDATWAQISAVSAAGTASSTWSVGDTKEVTLNGTVGTLALSNVSLYVYILGFDHNSATEGTGISFGGFKTAKTGGIDVALCDSHYDSTSYDGSKWFNLNHWGSNSSPYNTNYGGWKGCDARYDILGSTETAPSGYGSTATTSRVGYDATSAAKTSPVANTLMAALPSALRSVLKPITKYTDNKGNSSNTAANVTASVDYLPLLSEFEVQGARSYANEYEKNSQAQYDYYANGNSKIKYNHSSTSSAVDWWCRSAYAGTVGSFCFVSADGSAADTSSRYSSGLAPAFLV